MGYIVYTGKIGEAYSKLENAEKNKNIAQKRVDEVDTLIKSIDGIYTSEVKGLAFTAKESAANVYNALKEALESQTPGSYKYEQLANLVDDIKETLDTITSGTHADNSNVTVSEKLDSTAQNFDGLISELLVDATQLKTIKDEELSVATQAYNNAKTEFEKLLPINYSLEYLTLVALEDGTFSFYLGDSDTYMDSISYSIDNGETWVTYDGEERDITALTTPTITTGNKVLWKGIGKAIGDEVSHFESTGRFNTQGNIMSLLYGDDFVDKTQFDSEYHHQLNGLFENSKVVDANNLILPVTTLATRCYGYMFCGCTSLTTAPELPATTLIDECYYQMFYRCTSLTTAPELPATTLANNCYEDMFNGCTSLTIAPELPATTLASSCYRYMFQGCTNLTTAPKLLTTTLVDYCYQSMFNGCTSLTTAPELPATTLVSSCYGGMFQGCTSLTTAPELPATTLASECYYYMFAGCTSLTTAPELPATTLANWCYGNMFQGCTSLTTAPELPATALAERCYSSMFNGCIKLNSITCLATDISATNCTQNWVNNVASNGTFTKDPSMKNWTIGVNGIPISWTVIDAD